MPSFVTVLSDPKTKARYRQVVLVSGNTKTFLTNLDSSEVLEIKMWHPKDDKIYFMATKPHQPGAQHLYRVDTKAEKAVSDPECVTCEHNSTTTE